MGAKLRVAMLPASLKEIEVYEGMTVRKAFEVAGFHASPDAYKFRLDGVEVSMDTEIELKINTQTLVASKMIKGN